MLWWSSSSIAPAATAAIATPPISCGEEEGESDLGFWGRRTTPGFCSPNLNGGLSDQNRRPRWVLRFPAQAQVAARAGRVHAQALAAGQLGHETDAGCGRALRELGHEPSLLAGPR